MSDTKNTFQFADLETTRTQLRILQLSDKESVFKHFSDDAVTRMMDIESCKSVDEASEIILFHLNGSGCRWGIFDRDTNDLVGTCGFHCWTIDKPHATAEIGYDLGKAYWGKGLMQEVLRVVIPFGFEKMHLERIEAECSPKNSKSIRLLEKFGFRLDNILKNKQVRYYLQVDDWKAGNVRMSSIVN